MRHARLEKASPGRESEHDDADSEPNLDNEGVVALLEAGVDLPAGGDPIAGIRNGVIAGLGLWGAMALIFILIA